LQPLDTGQGCGDGRGFADHADSLGQGKDPL